MNDVYIAVAILLMGMIARIISGILGKRAIARELRDVSDLLLRDFQREQRPDIRDKDD